MVRTGDGAALPFSCASDDEIHFADTLLAKAAHYGRIRASRALSRVSCSRSSFSTSWLALLP